MTPKNDGALHSATRWSDICKSAISQLVNSTKEIEFTSQGTFQAGELSFVNNRLTEFTEGPIHFALVSTRCSGQP
jgi:hypothetical protein